MPDDADTILNRIGQENAEKLQAKINSWFGPDGEYAGYDEDQRGTQWQRLALALPNTSNGARES